MKKRVFSVEQKMEILRYAEENGMVGQHYKVDPAVRELEKENERLKKIIARQALELEVKGELLKKTLQQKRRSS